MTSKFSFVLSLACLCLLFVNCRSETGSIEWSRPNVILIMADDLGYEGIGCYGNTIINTPNLDHLASNGLKFTDFHSNGSVCSPTRAALLTGRYQQRSGIEGIVRAYGETRKTGLSINEVTIADVLRDSGYATGIMGKWHLGYDVAYNPINNGFDEFRGYVSGNIDFHSHYDGSAIYDWWHDKELVKEEGYVTDLITKHSVDFIDKHKDEPFFLYVPHEAPHAPFQGRNDPAFRFPDTEFVYYGPVSDTMATYKELVEVMDEGIGEIIQKVNSEGLANNTVIIFISDNGAERFGHNGDLNSHKSSLLEGGHRVPAIFCWPGMIKPGVSDETTMTFDLMPTIISICQASLPDNLDGIDLTSHLLYQTKIEERLLFWKYRKERAVRKNQFKLFVNETDTLLFDLSTDLAETKNIVSKNRKLKVELSEALDRWESEMNAYEQKTE